MGSIDDIKSILTQSALNALCENFHIHDTVHPELPGRNDRIRNSPTGKIDMDFFPFIHHADPTKARIGEKEVREGEVSLLELTRGRVVPLIGESDHAVQDEGSNIVRIKDEVSVSIAERAKGSQKKRKTAGGANGSSLPLKKLRADHGTSGVGASTGEKSVAMLQGLLERSTLHVEVGVTVMATLPFITYYVSLMPEREGDGHTDSVTGPYLRTQHPSERFVSLSDSPSHSSSNAADAEVSYVVKSLVLEPPIMTAAVATTVVADTSSIPVCRAGEEPVHASIFTDSTFAGTLGPDIAGPSQPACTKLSADTFYVSQDMNFETLHQIYVPRWNVVNESALDNCLFAEFNIGAARQTCLGVEVKMRLEHELRGRKKFDGKCAMQANLLKERDAKIASLKAHFSLKKAEATKAIRFRGQVATIEVAEATRVNELNEIASLAAQTAKLTQDLSELGLSCDELSVKASTLEGERDRLVDQVSSLEGICFGVRDKVMGYKLFKEQIEVVQDEQVWVLSEKVVGLDADLMGMALHLDEEFYPCFFTTIVGRRWFLGRGLKLVVMKCLQSPWYLTALGGVIDKGMQDGLAADIDHEKAGRGLANFAVYDPSTEANFVSTMNALCAMDFPFLAQLASQKDASIANIIGLVHSESLAAETPEPKQLQPSPEQLMFPIHRDAASQCLSITDTLVPLIERLSTENLIGEASTSGVLAMATTTALSTTFIQTNSVPPISVADHRVLGAGPSTEVPSPKDCF
nr:hypothetical protein [Tanacetum cinerariifolium]